MKKTILAFVLTAAAVTGGNLLAAGPAFAGAKVGDCDGGDRLHKDGLWYADKTCPKLHVRPGSSAAAKLSGRIPTSDNTGQLGHAKPALGEATKLPVRAPIPSDKAEGVKQPGCVLRPGNPLQQGCGGPAGK